MDKVANRFKYLYINNSKLTYEDELDFNINLSYFKIINTKEKLKNLFINYTYALYYITIN